MKKNYLFLLLLCVLFGMHRSMAQCPAGQWPLEITIVPDSYPNETTWNLFSNGTEIAQGTYLSDTVCVDSSSCMRFDIHDSYGDGICCGYGLGSYVITLNGNQVASGGEFATIASHSFNCGPGTICENPLNANLGLNTSPNGQRFFEFTPDSTGIYSFSTCGITTCDTRLWIYNTCQNVDYSGSSNGAMYYNDNNLNCGEQADLEVLLAAGVPYIVRIDYGQNLGNVQTFSCTGSPQTFTAPTSGNFTVEAWGAQGGDDGQTGAKGGYSKGTKYLNAGETLSIYVGGEGANCAAAGGGGWNGGGNAGDVGCSGGGGGASDVRYGGNALGDRILVAGGGGGTGCCGTPAGEGGGLSGINGSGLGGTQNAGGAGQGAGSLGQGGHKSGDGGGGGGGYYGGGASYNDDGGGGGSSYIGGVMNGVTIAGNATMPNLNGGTMTGNTGNGWVRVSWADTACAGNIPFMITYVGAMSSVLPIVKLTTLNTPINNNVKVPVKMEIIDHGLGQLNYSNDTIYSYEGNILAEWQGFTGPGYPKKNYDFDLIDAAGNKIDTSLMGLPAENDWIFKAEYLDNTLLKNSVAYYFSRKMGRYAPRTKHCEIFLDGNYIGVYTLTEKVKRDKDRLDIAKMTSTDTVGSALTGGYIIEMNINGAPAAWNSAYPPINNATSPHAVEFKYVYPKADSILPVQGNYIKTFVDSFENALNGVNFTNDSLGYRAWIDVSTFIDFLIVNEFSMNYDSYGRSTYMYKEKDTDGGKLCIGPPWDYDRAMASPPTSGWVWQNCHPYWPFPFWWSKMYTDSVYRHELACRWFSLRENELSNGNFMAFIDSTANLLYQGPAERNFAIWQSLNGVPYPQQVLNLKLFMYQRLTWIDETLTPFGAELPLVQIPEDTTVCVGITYTAPFNPLYSYNWKPGPETPEITLTNPGPYVLEVSDAFGCERNLPMNVGISAPDTTFNHLHVDAEYVFAGNNGNSSQYLWDFGDQTLWGNGQQVSHVYAVPGIYTVEMNVTDTLGCIGKSSQTLQITEGSIQVGIQPNPFQSNPTVVHNLPSDKAFNFILYDAAGRKLQAYDSPASPFTLETRGMAQGTYWLKCVFEGETITQSLIRL